MFLKRLKLSNYKNYTQAEIHFQNKFTLINGENGSGKTNLTDAVYYLCLCKSYFTRSDNLIAHHGELFFRLEGDFIAGAYEINITAIYQPVKKEFFKDDVIYDKLSDHIGLIPAVMIAPDDIEIMHDGSDVRRKFLDGAIAQLDSGYLQHVITYNKILLQRNAALKKFYDEKKIDTTLLNILNHQLAKEGDAIYAERKKYLEKFKPVFLEFYKKLCAGAEIPSIAYQSHLSEHAHLHLLMHASKRDTESQRTHYGIHKDDLLFSLDSYPLKETGSQGQIKSFLIALKLAQYKMIQEITEKKPVLLLDDIFEKLDKKRLHILFDMLKTNDYEQVLITDADAMRSSVFLQSCNLAYNPIEVKNGKIL